MLLGIDFSFSNFLSTARIGAEKPLLSVQAPWGAFVNQAVVSFAVTFLRRGGCSWEVHSATGREPVLTSSGSTLNGWLPASVPGLSCCNAMSPREAAIPHAV